MGVTIEFIRTGKIIKKTCSNLEDAKIYLCNFKGEGFIGWVDDKSFAVCVGFRERK